MIKFQKLKYSSNKRMQERIFPKPLIQQNVLNWRLGVVIEKRDSPLRFAHRLVMNRLKEKTTNVFRII